MPTWTDSLSWGIYQLKPFIKTPLVGYFSRGFILPARGRKSYMNCKVIQLYRWEVYEFPWGTAVQEQRTGKWTNIFLKPDGQEIDVSLMNVELHENGIEFLNY
jgi:hypothetical protein